MMQICCEEKEQVQEAVRTGTMDAAEMAIPNLVNDILLTIEKAKFIKTFGFCLRNCLVSFSIKIILTE